MTSKQSQNTAKNNKPTQEKVLDDIHALSKKILKAGDKFRFSEQVDLLHQLHKKVAECNRLPFANPDPHQYRGYPPNKESAYLFGTGQPAEVISRIEAFVHEYKKCDCPVISCECCPLEVAEVKTNGVTCWFCKVQLARFTTAVWLDFGRSAGTTVCETCSNILFDKLFRQRSVVVDIDNLIQDAYNEVKFLQFGQALRFIREAQHRAQRAVQLK